MTCAEARAFEAARLGADPADAVATMRAAGRGVAAEALRGLAEARGGLIAGAAAWILFGKGANGADALFAARVLGESGVRLHLVAAFDRRHWSPAVVLAYDELMAAYPGTVVHAALDALAESPAHPLVIDGLLGAGFRAPLAPNLVDFIRRLNAAPSRPFVVSVDLPSGSGDESDECCVRADLTVATGIVKAPLVRDERVRAAAGRIRYVDLGFFDRDPERAGEVSAKVAAPAIFAPLTRPYDAVADKRAHGHLLVVGGSPGMPGAQLMNTLGALHSGAGVVSAYAPEPVQPAFAGAAPEAIWVPVPLKDGRVNWTAALKLLQKNAGRYTAAVVGSGMGQADETAEFIRTLIREFPGRLVLDADALHPAILTALPGRPEEFGPAVLTPHYREFQRISATEPEYRSLRAYAERKRAIVVLKGAGTRVAAPGRAVLIPHGGPVLARGGTGDLLAGMIGARLAAEPTADMVEVVCRAVAWHARAGDHLAATRGALAVRTTDLCAAMGPALYA